MIVKVKHPGSKVEDKCFSQLSELFTYVYQNGGNCSLSIKNGGSPPVVELYQSVSPEEQVDPEQE